MKDRPKGDAALQEVRQILFGEQLAGVQGRIDSLDTRISDALKALEKEFRGRVDGLDASFRKRLDALEAKLETESGERTAVDKSVAAELTEIRSQLSDRTAALERDLDQKFGKLSSQLDREAAGLREGKADRNDLSELFAGIARRLNANGAEKGEAAEAAAEE